MHAKDPVPLERSAVDDDDDNHYNGDEVPFVSLNDIGDKSGSFHDSIDTNNIRVNKKISARSMNLDDDDGDEAEKKEEDVATEAVTVRLQPLHEDTDHDTDSIDATVVEVNANDYINNTEVFRILSDKIDSLMEKKDDA